MAEERRSKRRNAAASRKQALTRGSLGKEIEEIPQVVVSEQGPVQTRPVQASRRCWYWGSRTGKEVLLNFRRVTKERYSRIVLEKRAAESESLVDEISIPLSRDPK